MLFDDELDFESDADRARMMEELRSSSDDEDALFPTNPIRDTSPVVVHASGRTPPSGTSSRAGAPYLRVDISHGLLLLRELDPGHSALRGTPISTLTLTVRVDWGNCELGEASFVLAARHRGVELMTSTAPRGRTLEVAVSCDGLAQGDTVLMELRWSVIGLR